MIYIIAEKLSLSLREVAPQENSSRKRTRERPEGSLRKLLKRIRRRRRRKKRRRRKDFSGKWLSCCKIQRQESTNDQAPGAFIYQGFYWCGNRIDILPGITYDLDMQTTLTWHSPTMEATTNFILFSVSIILELVNGPKLRMDNYYSR